VLVDNDSDDGVVDRVHAEHPRVELIAMRRNAGFGAACNAAITELGDVDYIALVNNDATVDPGWLSALVAACVDSAGVGAACPKILLSGHHGAVSIDVPARERGRGDHRRLGVRLSGVRVDGNDVWVRTQLVSGFWGREPDGQWTADHALLYVPLPATGDATVELCLTADTTRDAVITAGDARANYTVGVVPAWYALRAPLERFDVVNSAGAMLLDGGYGADRGYLQADRGQFGDATEVFAWSGAGVVLSRSYVADVGLFHEPLFLYYEDLDLSWRGRARGWRHVYVPDAVERHEHAASSVAGSALFDHYVERNRLVVLARNAPPRMAWAAVVRFVLTTASYFRRDCLVPPLFGRRPRLDVVRRRTRAFLAFVRMLPGVVVQRRRLRHRRTVGDDDVRRWLAPGPTSGPTALTGSE